MVNNSRADPLNCYVLDYFNSHLKVGLKEKIGYMDSQKPQKIVSDLVQAGAYKSNLPARDILIRGFLSGSLLGFATVLAFTATVETGLGIIGAIVFPVSFVMIILLGLELVTGNFAAVPIAILGKFTSLQKLLRNWTLAFLGNLVGSVFFGLLFYIYITKLGRTFDSGVVEHLLIVAENKTLAYKKIGGEGLIIVFVKAVLCNWMVTLGVVMGLVSSSTIGKIAAIWLPIFTFFALGLEHAVVNMFLIPTAMMMNAEISLADWWFWNQIPATLGNIIGGAVFTGGLLYATHYRSKSFDDSNKTK